MILGTAAAFLFDMDGTLISSIAATERVWGRWAAGHGLDVPAFLRTIHGIRAVEVIGRLRLPGVDPAREAARIAQEELEDLAGIVPIAGALRFLAGLPRERWGIVTSAPRVLAAARLDAAGIEPPPVLVTAEDVVAGKPAPDCFRLGAERLGLRAKDCLVFEDAPAGIAAAEAAGAAVVIIDADGASSVAAARHPVVRSYDELAVTVEGDVLVLTRPDRAALTS